MKYWRISENLHNFGDVLSLYLARRLTCITQSRPEVQKGGVSTWMIGSVIDDWLFEPLAESSPPEIDHVFWSCGLRIPVRPSNSNLSRSLFLAVRGPLTRNILGLPSATPLGDFGLLTSLAYPELSDSGVSAVTLLVPHFSDSRSDEELIELTGVDKVLRPRIKGGEPEVKEIIRAIANAEFVLCGALHAGIVAASFNVPFAFWDSGQIDIPFKWDDFAQSIGIQCSFARTLDEGREIYLRNNSSIVLPPLSSLLATCPVTPKRAAVIAAFEFDLKKHDINFLLPHFLDASRSFSENLLTRLEEARATASKALDSTKLELDSTKLELDSTKLELDSTKLELGYTLVSLPRILRKKIRGED